MMTGAAGDSFTLAGKVALITGATLKPAGVGIGGATARLMARRGARVAVADIDGEGAGCLAEELCAAGYDAIALPLDLADADSARAAVDAVIARHGAIDILHNNAAGGSRRDTSVDDLDLEAWDHTFAINARGTMLMSKFALPSMLARGHGVIVNMSSNSALLGDLGRTAYGASKAAINALTLYTATQYGRRGIRCNAICPGLTMSASARSSAPDAAYEPYRRHLLTPFAGEPEHLAEVVAFLASDAAAYMNGQVVQVDGGMFAHQPTTPEFAARG